MAVAVVALIALGVGLNAALGGSSRGAGATAPPVEGPISGGGRFSLASERQHWVLVNFFASWCTDCREELGQLTTLERSHPGGLQVVSVDGADDSLSAADALIRRAGGSWPLVNDPGALAAYGVTGLPQSFLVDPSGRVVDRTFGVISATHIATEVSSA